MKHLEIIANLEDIGSISEDINRRQTLSLKDVATFSGDYLQGETVKIYICDSATSKIVDDTLKQYK